MSFRRESVTNIHTFTFKILVGVEAQNIKSYFSKKYIHRKNYVYTFFIPLKNFCHPHKISKRLKSSNICYISSNIPTRRHFENDNVPTLLPVEVRRNAHKTAIGLKGLSDPTEDNIFRQDPVILYTLER